MKKYLNVLKNCPVFSDIQETDIIPLLSCLGATVKSYKKGQTIFSVGDKTSNIGILLCGTIQLQRLDYDGVRSIITNLSESDLFLEAFAFSGTPLTLYAIAQTNSEVMYIESSRLTKSCANSCDFHNKIIYNFLKLMAQKNIGLNQKSQIISKRTTRAKLMSYLSLYAEKVGSKQFTIPFNRQELADYLEVERSGLSLEISKLRKEGIIESKKSKFTLKT